MSRFMLALAAALALAPALAAAQGYPTKPIRMVVPFPAGGGTDIIARIVAPRLSEALGQSVVIDNRGGAGGNIGTDIVAKSVPDGYTLLMAYSSHATNPGLYPKLPFDAVRDFAAISLVATVPQALSVNASVPVKSVRDLVELAKAKPGQINYASSGGGTPNHLAAELFNRMAGISTQHVPYKGVAPGLTALMGNEVQFMFPTVLSASAQLKAGRIRALAVTSIKRSASLPEVPTLSESGLTGYEALSWYGFLAPAKVPPAVLTRLSTEAMRIVKLPEVRESLAGQGAEPVGNTPPEFERFVVAEIKKWTELIRTVGIKAD
jgi:tripartite-type tricarboxylate transporter receptor subunit TctC